MNNTLSVLFIILSITSAIYAILGLVTGTVKFGYKYYGKGITASKKTNPTNFWVGVILYMGISIGALIIALRQLIN
jgi:hypothetical protein